MRELIEDLWQERKTQCAGQTGIDWTPTTGTSVAAGEVSGIVALLLERNRKLTPGASHRPEPKLWSRSPVPSRFALEVRMPRMLAGAPASRPARAGSMSAPEG